MSSNKPMRFSHVFLGSVSLAKCQTNHHLCVSLQTWGAPQTTGVFVHILLLRSFQNCIYNSLMVFIGFFDVFLWPIGALQPRFAAELRRWNKFFLGGDRPRRFAPQPSDGTKTPRQATGVASTSRDSQAFPDPTSQPANLSNYLVIQPTC